MIFISTNVIIKLIKIRLRNVVEYFSDSNDDSFEGTNPQRKRPLHKLKKSQDNVTDSGASTNLVQRQKVKVTSTKKHSDSKHIKQNAQISKSKSKPVISKNTTEYLSDTSYSSSDEIYFRRCSPLTGNRESKKLMRNTQEVMNSAISTKNPSFVQTRKLHTIDNEPKVTYTYLSQGAHHYESCVNKLNYNKDFYQNNSGTLEKCKGNEKYFSSGVKDSLLIQESNVNFGDRNIFAKTNDTPRTAITAKYSVNEYVKQIPWESVQIQRNDSKVRISGNIPGDCTNRSGDSFKETHNSRMIPQKPYESLESNIINTVNRNNRLDLQKHLVEQPTIISYLESTKGWKREIRMERKAFKKCTNSTLIHRLSFATKFDECLWYCTKYLLFTLLHYAGYNLRSRY